MSNSRGDGPTSDIEKARTTLEGGALHVAPPHAPQAPLVASGGRGEHPMLTSAKRARAAGGMTGFFGGLRLALASIAFLLRRPAMWPQVVIPALINIVLFGLTLILLFSNIGDWFDLIWTRPVGAGLGSYLALGLWWLARILLVPVTIAFSYFLTLLVGGVIASPFNDALSEKIEGELLGQPVSSDGGAGALISGGVRGVLTSAAVLGLYLACLLVLLPLNLLPGVGSAAATLLGALLGAFFLAVEYTDSVLERRKYRLREKLAAIWRNRAFAGGFGLGTSLLLWIPLLNFLCMPIAVVGGTTVALAVDHADAPGAATPT